MFSVVAWIRIGWRNGLTTLAVGLGFVFIYLALSLVFVSMITIVPSWVSAPLFVFLSLILWMLEMRYYFSERRAGGLLLTIAQAKKKTEKNLIVLFAVLIFLNALIIFNGLRADNSPLRAPTGYAFIFFLISVAILSLVRKSIHIQIHQNGILTKNGRFYNWRDIEAYNWKFADEYFQITLQNLRSNNTVKIYTPHARKQEIIPYLEKYIKHPGSV